MASLTMGPCISAHGRQQKSSNCWSSGLSALTLHVLDSVCVCVCGKDAISKLTRVQRHTQTCIEYTDH